MSFATRSALPRSASPSRSPRRSCSFARRITRRRPRSRVALARAARVAIHAEPRAALAVDHHALAGRVVGIAGIAPLDASGRHEPHADDARDVIAELRAGSVDERARHGIRIVVRARAADRRASVIGRGRRVVVGAPARPRASVRRLVDHRRPRARVGWLRAAFDCALRPRDAGCRPGHLRIARPISPRRAPRGAICALTRLRSAHGPSAPSRRPIAFARGRRLRSASCAALAADGRARCVAAVAAAAWRAAAGCLARDPALRGRRPAADRLTSARPRCATLLVLRFRRACAVAASPPRRRRRRRRRLRHRRQVRPPPPLGAVGRGRHHRVRPRPSSSGSRGLTSSWTQREISLDRELRGSRCESRPRCATTGSPAARFAARCRARRDRLRRPPRARAHGAAARRRPAPAPHRPCPRRRAPAASDRGVAAASSSPSARDPLRRAGSASTRRVAAAEPHALAAAADRRQQLLGRGRAQHEQRARRRLLERLEQRVRRGRRHRGRFLDDEHADRRPRAAAGRCGRSPGCARSRSERCSPRLRERASRRPGEFRATIFAHASHSPQPSPRADAGS